MKKMIIGALSTMALVHSSAAVTLLQYNFAADLNPSTLGANVAGTPTALSGGSKSERGPGQHVTIENATGALVDGLIGFTISTTNGDLIDLNSLAFDNYSGSIPLNYEVFVNGVSAAPEQAAIASSPFTNTTSLSAYANAASFDIELRAKSPGTDSASNLVRIDNITIDGDLVAVPEPSSTALLGLGGLALILRRRK